MSFSLIVSYVMFHAVGMVPFGKLQIFGGGGRYPIVLDADLFSLIISTSRDIKFVRCAGTQEWEMVSTVYSFRLLCGVSTRNILVSCHLVCLYPLIV